MNLIYIKTFLEIAATGNFERAARNLNIAQSTASAGINTLEESLGIVCLAVAAQDLKSQLQEYSY